MQKIFDMGITEQFDTILDSGFSLIDKKDPTETKTLISSRAMAVRDAKAKFFTAMKKETLWTIIKRLPERNEYFHIVSNGKFDYFTFLPVILSNVHHIEEFYGSTRTMNLQNVLDLLKFIDTGMIDKVAIITGLYFKRRETSVHSVLLQSLHTRGMRYISCENHSKVMLIRAKDNFYVIEGSANWTGNPRIEQDIITNSEQVYNFHKEWMDSLFEG